MDREFEHLNEKEAIKAENDFLKLKMMLENGAHIGSTSNPEFTPEMENFFLKNVMAFENAFNEQKRVCVYDKIERPTIFKPVADVSDAEVEAALDSLLEWLAQYGILLEVGSPNVSMRELYRFILEELFEYQMDDIDLPGYTNTFIYDEFHPDPHYETQHAAVDECIKLIFNKSRLDWLPHFKLDELQLNDHQSINEEQLKKYVNNFKAAYDEIECLQVSEILCTVNEEKATVKGQYEIKLTIGISDEIRVGQWQVDLETSDNFYWYIYNVQIEGIKL